MIAGERIVIRPMEPDDLDYLMKWRNSPEAMNYSEHLYGFLFSRDNMMRMVENQFREDGFFPGTRPSSSRPGKGRLSAISATRTGTPATGPPRSGWKSGSRNIGARVSARRWYACLWPTCSDT